MRTITIAAAALALAGILAGCMGPSTGATPEPTGPAPAGPTENPIVGPSDGAGKPSPSLEVPPPAY